MKRPLIAHIIYRLDYGGLENGLVNLINRLPEDLAQHVVVTLAGHSDFRSRIQRQDVEVLSLNKRPGKDPAMYARCYRLLRQLRPAIVHTRNLGTIDLQWVACAARVPARVHGEHGWDAADAAGVNPRTLRIRRLCRPVIHRYVAVSNDIAGWLQRRVGVAPSRITTIINGVDTERFTKSDAHLFGDQKGERHFLFGTVGRLDPIKNHSALLQAFARLSREFPDRPMRLAIVGSGPLQASLQQQATALNIADKVWMPGARDDVAALLQTMDVFVLPSLNEGISNTLLEAMATGRAIIAANVGGNSELIRSGQEGLLYDPGADGQLCDLMRTYLMDQHARTTHGAKARQTAVERFSIASMVSGYAQLYQSLLRS